MNAWAIGRSTMNRLAATQLCPALRNFATSAPASARSRSASSSTTNGALPPSPERDTRRVVSAQTRAIDRPTVVEPVKLTLRIASEPTSCPPIRAPSPVTTLITPGGTPRSWAKPASARVVSGVASAGLHTTVQPTASAGPSLRVSIAAGKFQGVISAHGPTGARCTSMRWPTDDAGTVSP